MMEKALILTFEDPREDVRKRRRAIVEEELDKLKASLEGRFEVCASEPIGDKLDAMKALDAVNEREFSAAILHVPVFVDTSVVCFTARSLGLPLMLVSNRRPDSHGTVGFLAVKGALGQMGIGYKGLLGDVDDRTTTRSIMDFVKAAAVIKQMEGQTIGVFGGPALGIVTCSADQVQWLDRFGVFTKHIDQASIIETAYSIDQKEVDKAKAWFLEKEASGAHPETFAASSGFDRQVRSYLATKRICREKKIDFISLQCQPALSEGYIQQCLNCALSNDPYDEGGIKETIALSCEGDMDGALTMQVLKLASGGSTTALLDLRMIPEKGPLTLTNCGGMSTWFAAHSADSKENLAAVKLMPHIFGNREGLALSFVAGRCKATLARLYRRKYTYRMLIAPGEVVDEPAGGVQDSLRAFPHVFFDGDFDRQELLEHLGSNHIHLVDGDVSGILENYCSIMGIECINLRKRDVNMKGAQS